MELSDNGMVNASKVPKNKPVMKSKTKGANRT
jgi:hypothetical protein